MPSEIVYKPIETVKKYNIKPKLNVEFGKKFISKWTVGTTGNSNIYTVPEDKVFILLSCWGGYSVDNATGGGSHELRTKDPNNQMLLYLEAKTPPAGTIYQDSLSMSYGSGLILPGKTIFWSYNGSGGRFSCGFSGYEIKKKNVNFL